MRWHPYHLALRSRKLGLSLAALALIIPACTGAASDGSVLMEPHREVAPPPPTSATSISPTPVTQTSVAQAPLAPTPAVSTPVASPRVPIGQPEPSPATEYPSTPVATGGGVSRSQDIGEGQAAGQSPPLAFNQLPDAPERDLFRLAYESLLPPGYPEVPPVVNRDPVSYGVGRVDRFHVVDLENNKRYQSDFELRFVSPHAYWYIEEGMRVDQDELERAAREYEEVIYPRVTSYFGREWTPGVDNDPRLTIVHGHIRGAGGYFSSADEYPVAVRPYSNQREMIYINIRYLQVGSRPYLGVLAHELSHAIMWRHDSSEDTWVNEGLAELAVTLAGYTVRSMEQYLVSPHLSLVHWPLDYSSIGAYYGSAALFMHYLHEDYSGPNMDALRELMAAPADDIAGVDQYLESQGYDEDFHAVFKNWIAANFLDEAGSNLGYEELNIQVVPSRTLSRPDEIDRKVAQYGTHYIELGSSLRNAPVSLRFQGQGENRLLPTEVADGGCWWSNSGDSITSTLTRSVDLTGVAQPTLTYQTWYSIEEDWDYVYLQVSEDGGSHWDILETSNTSSDDPLDVAFGPGYTGRSGGWISERVDLSNYGGRPILVRFQYVTDDALNGIGLCLADLVVTGAGSPIEGGGWEPDGFVLTNNRVPQDFIVQVIQKGKTNRVMQLPVSLGEDGDWHGELVVEPFVGLERTVVSVTPIAPKTREMANYTLTVSRAE